MGSTENSGINSAAKQFAEKENTLVTVAIKFKIQRISNLQAVAEPRLLPEIEFFSKL